MNALITGCNRGIGLALAIEFATHGWHVFATARKPSIPELERFENVTVLPLDVTDDASVARLAASLTVPIDVLVNNAAVFPGEGRERLEETEIAWFGEAFDCNVTGSARVIRSCLPLLRKAKNARVANISSGAGSISEKEDFAYYPYSVSKAALNMLTRAIAAELRGEGIVVSAISPGWVRTDMGGENAPLTTKESAASLYKTITSLTADQAGEFLGRDGERYAW